MSDFLFAPTPHKEAMEFISGKTIVSREVFAELLPELRARAFTIAGVTSFDVLQRVREELATLPAGGDWNEVKKSVVEEIHPFLADPEDPENTDAAERRAETLLKTHGFQAYSAASYKVMDRQRAVFPFWQYHSMGDGHVRPTHGALNGIVLPANSPFWKGHFPPWEWGCRCQVIPLMQEEVDAMKEKEADKPVEKREVLEGVPLQQLEDQHRLTRGPDQVWDVRTAAEKGDHKGLRWNPDDLRITPQMLEGRYDPVVWATFERWARATPIHEKENLTVWEWMGGKKMEGVTEVDLPGTPIRSAPASNAVRLPGSRSAVNKIAVLSLRAIDLVHDDGLLPSITLDGKPGKYLGVFRSSNMGGAVSIGVKSTGQWPHMTACHEMGHFIDFGAFGANRTFASDSDPLFEDFRKATQHSAAIQRIKSSPLSTKDKEYFLRPREIWARAYAQWIAEKSKDPVLIAEMKKLAASPRSFRVWTQSDFEEISRAIDAIFSSKGWL